METAGFVNYAGDRFVEARIPRRHRRGSFCNQIEDLLAFAEAMANGSCLFVIEWKGRGAVVFEDKDCERQSKNQNGKQNE